MKCSLVSKSPPLRLYPSANDSSETYHSTPVSQGVTKGHGRVEVISLEEAGRLKPGENLITLSTDIGWSPYFLNVSGVVTEIRGTHITRLDGTLDVLKTAQALVQRQDADISSRFKIASSYLWLDDMLRLRQESPNTCEGLLASFQQGTMMNYWEGRRASMSSPISNSGQTMIIEGHCCICGNVSEEI
ncbi:hypothetical protein CDAR_102151 [Caerostris darwini]|uniref:Uncharacterized protein n=1 Tax=Caerostris darwini TaxID=1538125 RepID=A0AAV4UPT4_9ARAC|nr:hypothetical protein CDAR_102151 [Caerostris darwini]